jgi:hypothetical protein
MKQIILGMIILPTLIFPAFALDKAMKSFFEKSALKESINKNQVVQK